MSTCKIQEIYFDKNMRVFINRIQINTVLDEIAVELSLNGPQVISITKDSLNFVGEELIGHLQIGDTYIPLAMTPENVLPEEVETLIDELLGKVQLTEDILAEIEKQKGQVVAQIKGAMKRLQSDSEKITCVMLSESMLSIVLETETILKQKTCRFKDALVYLVSQAINREISYTEICIKIIKSFKLTEGQTKEVCFSEIIPIIAG